MMPDNLLLGVLNILIKCIYYFNIIYIYQTLLSKATYSAFRLYIYCQYVCSLGIEPTTFALLTQCSTTEPQEHISWKGLSSKKNEQKPKKYYENPQINFIFNFLSDCYATKQAKRPV